MNVQLLALIIQQGGNILSQFLNQHAEQSYIKAHMQRPEDESQAMAVAPAQVQEVQVVQVNPARVTAEPVKKEAVENIATGCIPCAIGHMGTCSGLLNESMRFARSEGLTSPEVLTRVNQCQDELNAMERVDLRPEKIADLPQWHKELALVALESSRKIRHGLEGLTSVEELEGIAGATQKVRTGIGNAWLKRRIEQLPKTEQDKVNKVLERAGQH